MQSPRILLSYRPLKIGWLLGEKDMELFRQITQSSHCFWGGRYNPIIPAYDNKLADKLMLHFNPDVLLSLPDDKTAHEYEKKYPHLRRFFFEQPFQGDRCYAVDVRHPIRRLHQKLMVEGKNRKDRSAVNWLEWEATDPLSNLFFVRLGKYPDSNVGQRLGGQFLELLFPNEFRIDSAGAVPIKVLEEASPNDVCVHDLELKVSLESHWPGVLIADSQKLEDLVLFWNIRSSGFEAEFYDPNYAGRLDTCVSDFLHKYRENGLINNDGIERSVSVFQSSIDFKHNFDLEGLTEQKLYCKSGFFDRQYAAPARITFSGRYQDVIASTEKNDWGDTITFPLYDKPFSNERGSEIQSFVTSLNVSNWEDENGIWCFKMPFIPKLNEFYSQSLKSEPTSVRAETSADFGHSIGIITRVEDQRQSLTAVNPIELLKQIFSLAGIDRLERSDKGIICARLIQQLGGLQGCRVLKIRGVRDLIAKFEPETAFSRNAALRVIGSTNDPDRKVSFSDFQDLILERGSGPILKPQDAFDFLLKREVFRVGLEPKCPSCQLKSWLHIDEVKTQVKCSFCGVTHNLAPQLSDKGDWRFRRSGLFGKKDSQGGAIPVAITLQQMQSNAGLLDYIWYPSLNIGKSNEFKCEIDFLFMFYGDLRVPGAPLDIVIGESKSKGGKVDANDVNNLGRLASLIPAEIATTYIMFSKTGRFDDQELELISGLNTDQNKRVVIWSVDELEPYYTYQRSREELGGKMYIKSISEMALTTHELFFSKSSTNQRVQ